MSLSWFFFRGGKGSGTSLPVGFEFAPDGSLRLTGNATVFNDQLSNKITGDANIVEYALASTSYQQKTEYGIYKNKVWVKISVNPGEVKVLKFVPGSGSANNKMVFILYDDFNTSDNTTWVYQRGGVDGHSHLKVDGGNNVYGSYTRASIPTNVIVEWNMYSRNYDFDSGIKLGNVYCISDRGSGLQAICTSICYPGGSQQANKWNDYQAIFTPNETRFTNLTVNKTVSSTSRVYKGGSYLQFVCDSDTSANPLLVDYVCVRKYYDESKIDINVSTDSEGNYIVEVRNLSSEPLFEIQVPIDGIPIDYYTVYVESITPVITTLAFPPNVDSSITFFTQFDHSPKYGSSARFHIHAYIPPDATTGNVKFKFEWQLIPVEVIVTNSGSQVVNNYPKILKVVEKTFMITEDFHGRHVLFNFGEIDTVNSLSQIVFHRLTRLGSDPDDTFQHDLPILYVDWHTEIDSIGSQDEFIK